jgi:hypothetical protein
MIIKIAVIWEVMNVYTRRMLPTFRRNMRPKISGQKSNSLGKTRVQIKGNKGRKRTSILHLLFLILLPWRWMQHFPPKYKQYIVLIQTPSKIHFRSDKVYIVTFCGKFYKKVPIFISLFYSGHFPLEGQIRVCYGVWYFRNNIKAFIYLCQRQLEAWQKMWNKIRANKRQLH